MQEIEAFATKQKQDKKCMLELEEKLKRVQVGHIRFICTWYIPTGASCVRDAVKRLNDWQDWG